VNFDIKRFYLGIDHTFDDVFSANLTTDFTYDSGSPSATQLYIKKAYLQAKLSDALTFRLGSADLPWVPFVEDAYGYRYVENVMIDRDKYGTSADWGVHVLGKLADGLIGYQVSVVNGAGYKKAPTNPTNRSQGIDVEGRVNLNYDGFILALGGYHGKLGKDVQKATPESPDSTARSANRFDVLGAYADNGIRVGVEYFKTNNWNTVASTSAKDDADGVSIFGSYQFDPEWGVFGRYDWVNPTTTSTITGFQTANPTDRYFNVGVSYSPAKIVDFALVYKHDKVHNGTMSTSNGTIGGAYDGTYNEIGLWGQLRW
jgi:predicted porin